MRERYCIDAARYVVQCSLNFRAGIAALLDSDRTQDQLKIILHAMLHFAKADIAVLCFSSGGGSQPHRLIWFGGEVSHKDTDHRADRSEKLRRILAEVSGRRAIDF